MWLPTFIYESIPYVSFGVGGLSLFYANNLLMIISGLMLVVAGATIWKMRRDYRKDRAARERARARLAARRR